MESNGVTIEIGTLTDWMEKLDQFNLENRETGLGKYRMREGEDYQGEEGIYFCFAAEDRMRVGYRDTDLTHDWGKNPVKVKSLVGYIFEEMYGSKVRSEWLSQLAQG